MSTSFCSNVEHWTISTRCLLSTVDWQPILFIGSDEHKRYVRQESASRNPAVSLTVLCLWQLVPAKAMKTLQDFRELFRPDKNSRNFRKVLQTTLTPCIPHLGEDWLSSWLWEWHIDQLNSSHALITRDPGSWLFLVVWSGCVCRHFPHWPDVHWGW